jgi:hypothetical protein
VDHILFVAFQIAETATVLLVLLKIFFEHLSSTLRVAIKSVRSLISLIKAPIGEESDVE